MKLKINGTYDARIRFSVAQAAELPSITILATGARLPEVVKLQFLQLIKQGNSMLMH